MHPLIRDFQSDHSTLTASLERAKELGVTTKEGISVLMDAKIQLLVHLDKEDLRLYPVLNRAAKRDDTLKMLLDGFAKDMGEITELAVSFFEKYEASQDGSMFSRDIGRLIGALKSRIDREEKILYKMFIEVDALTSSSAIAS